ncbi:MAG: ankyrin repeat domain-containing protein [Acidobacteria bacterium]|nr:ankyrin repeat domain-containing protein [Acidobacteriota bacterium]
MPYLRFVCLVLLLCFPLLLHAQDLNEEILAAARKSDVAKIKELLAKGADVNAKSPYGATPLFFACDRGSVEVVKLLLENGADANIQDTFYKATPLGWAMNKGKPEIIKLLVEGGAKGLNQAMNFAINGNHIELAKITLEKAKFPQEDLDKYLRVASKKGQKEIVEALKAAGAKELPEFKIEAEAMKKYEGTFKGDNLTLIFQAKEGKLIGTANGQEAILVPLKLHTFENADAGIVATFTVDGDNVTGLALKFPNQLMNLKKEMPK